MTNINRHALGLSLLVGAVLVSGGASGDPPTPVVALQISSRAKATASPAEKAAVTKAVNAGLAIYAKDKSVAKLLGAGAGLTGNAHLTFQSAVAAITTANALTPSARYSIESGSVSATAQDPAHQCRSTLTIDLTVKNRFGAAATTGPAPTLEGVSPGWGNTLVSAPAPRLGTGQTGIVHLPPMTVVSPFDPSTQHCNPSQVTLDLAFTGVGNVAAYELSATNTTATLTSGPLGAPLGGSGIDGVDIPNHCDGGGWFKCTSGLCIPPGISCPP